MVMSSDSFKWCRYLIPNSGNKMFRMLVARNPCNVFRLCREKFISIHSAGSFSVHSAYLDIYLFQRRKEICPPFFLPICYYFTSINNRHSSLLATFRSRSSLYCLQCVSPIVLYKIIYRWAIWFLFYRKCQSNCELSCDDSELRGSDSPLARLLVLEKELKSVRVRTVSDLM